MKEQGEAKRKGNVKPDIEYQKGLCCPPYDEAAGAFGGTWM
jgi:hypothetical protein